MDDTECKKFIHVLEYLDNVDGMLTNVKGRSGKAAAQAVASFKKEGATVPSWKPMAVALVKLTKAETAADKAIKEINKIGALAADKKKGASLSLADAKKKAREQLPKLQEVDDIAAELLGLQQKVWKEFGSKTLEEIYTDQTLDMKALVEKYIPMFVKYYASFKMELNKLK